MSGKPETPHAIVEAMIAMVDPTGVAIIDDQDRIDASIGGTTIAISDGSPHAFEQLASAIEARIAFERATAMVDAAGETGVPLWLVSGSSVLAKWLAWSRTDRALAKTLSLTDQVGTAPIFGRFARRARRELGHMAVKIRVSGGQAVAERIELSHRVPAVAVLGDKATIRLRRQHLPETIVTALEKDPTRNDRRRAAEIIEHPFLADFDVMVEGVRNDGDDAIVKLETVWQPLAPVPEAAWASVPRGADPRFPWRATEREVADIYRLAASGALLLQQR